MAWKYIGPLGGFDFSDEDMEACRNEMDIANMVQLKHRERHPGAYKTRPLSPVVGFGTTHVDGSSVSYQMIPGT